MAETLHRGLVAPWEACETVRRELLSVFGEAPPSLWSAAPAEGGWSLARQLDHLRLSEIGTSKMARRLIRGDFAGLTRPREAKLYDSTLAAYPYEALGAPAGLQPGEPAFAEAIEQLAAVHQRFFEELGRFQGQDPDGPAAPDPATGVWFTLAGWVRLQALHEAHHLRAVRTRLASR